jgi:hypothetical protein
MEKMVNSPVEKKHAKRICPKDGGDWSIASAVILNVVSLCWDTQDNVYCALEGLNTSMVGRPDGLEEAVITSEPASSMCGLY